MKTDASKPMPRQLDLWWASLPEPAGRRPGLLLSRTSAYAYLTRILCVEATTTVRGILQEVALGKREQLPRACVANLDALGTLPTAALTDRIGRHATEFIARHAGKPFFLYVGFNPDSATGRVEIGKWLIQRQNL